MPRIASSTPTTTKRRTVALSVMMMSALDDLAAAEQLPVATVVRRAIADYVQRGQAAGPPDVDLSPFKESGRRRGKRGPSVKWPRSVSYVLPMELSDALVEIANGNDWTENEVARRAVAFALGREVLTERPMSRLDHGFVTKAKPSTADDADRAIVATFNTLNRDGS